MKPARGTPAPQPVVRLIPELVDYGARLYGNAPFLLRWTASGWQARSYAEAAVATHAFARLLQREGVRPGDRVGLLSENRAEWGLAYLAILETGAVAVPLDAALQPREVGEILATAGAGTCVVSARLLPMIEQTRAERLPALRLVGLDERDGLPGFDEAQRVFPGATALAPVAAPDDLAVLIFTSGTTGQAKGVMLSHANLLYNVETVARTFEFGPGDRFLSVLPLHHTFESTGGFLCPMRVGASVAYARGLKSNELREDIRTSGATLFIGVPLLYEKLLAAIHKGVDDAPWPRKLIAHALLAITRIVRLTTGRRIGHALMRPLREASGLDRLRLFVSGASPLPREVFWGFCDLGWSILEGYGLTECSPVVVANRPHHPHPGAVGWPLPGVEVRIVDPDEDGDGEIAVRGPNVMLGYYGQPEATAEVMRDGWFYTGDLGRVQADGRIKVTGRLKNMIATAAGKKIYPEEVESVLADCPYVLEVVVVGGRDPRGEREEVHAHVFPNRTELELLARATGRSFDAPFVESVLKREVESRCQQLAPYKRVKRLFLRDEEFPKTTTGKIRRQGLTPDAPGVRAVQAASAVA